MIVMSKPRPRRAIAWPIRPKPTRPERSAAHRGAGEMIGLRAGIDAGAEQPVAERDVARHRQQQAEADIGGGVGDDRRNIGDGNAAPRRLGEIDAVARDVHRRYRLEVRIGGEHLGIDGVVQQRNQDIAALDRFDQLALSSTRLESGLTSTSAISRNRLSALSAIGWVTKTRGRAKAGSLIRGLRGGYRAFRKTGGSFRIRLRSRR